MEFNSGSKKRLFDATIVAPEIYGWNKNEVTANPKIT